MRQRRNLMATLLLGQGTPMILMGDERGRSQGGNNNAYCQAPEETELAFEDFVRRLIRVRAGHGLFLAERFLHAGPDARRNRFAKWLRPDGAEMEPADWDNGESRAVGLLMHEATTFLLMAMNASEAELDFVLPGGADRKWTLMVDTAQGIADARGRSLVHDGSTILPGRSLLLLETGLEH
jgi:isoamylase